MPTTYERLYALSSPHLEAYRDDLEKHDRNALEARPNCPFLHFTRSASTYLAFLLPAADYPPRGVRVPYLFGMADREHLLRGVLAIVRYAKQHDPDCRLSLYFDGTSLKRITPEKAEEIAVAYIRRIEQQWREPHCV